MNQTLYLVCFISTKLDTVMATSPLYGEELREGLKLSPVEGTRVDIHTPVSLYLACLKSRSQSGAIEETVRLFSDLGTDNRRHDVEKAIEEYIAGESAKSRKMKEAAYKATKLAYPNKGNRIMAIQLTVASSGASMSECRKAVLEAWEALERAEQLQVTEGEAVSP